MGPRQRTGIATAVVVLVGAVGAGIALTTGADPTDRGRDQANRSAPATDPQTRRGAAAAEALAGLAQAVDDEDRAAFTALYGGEQGDQLYDTLTALPLSDWDLRLIAEDDRASTTWVGDVEVSWSLEGFDEREVDTEVDVTFTYPDDDGKTEVRSIEPDVAARTPEWLLGETEVRRSRNTLVVSARGDLTKRATTQARQAVRDVRQVVGDARDPVVVVVPSNTRQLAGMVGSDPAQYQQIAAVTSTVDGTSDSVAPVRIFLNPPVYRSLGTSGAQVVLSHEATHAMTRAATTQVPLWLIEGFADYVALADEPVPLEAAASQILGQVRSGGPPPRLPSEDDFDSKAGGLGASYEAAWLACRMVAEQHGERALLRFYRRALRTGNLDAAMSDVLGTDTTQLTRDWRAYLRELA